MDRPEESGEQDCSWPEAHTRAQGVEPVPAHQKLFRKAYAQKGDCPEDGVIDRFPAPERKTSEGEIVHRPQDDQERGECHKPETDSLPELCSKGAPCRDVRVLLVHSAYPFGTKAASMTSDFFLGPAAESSSASAGAAAAHPPSPA